MQVTELPFNRSLGLKSDGAAICLEPQPQHLNHLETVHASVLFGLAEAASGHLLLRQFAELQNRLCVLRSSTVKYRRPAAANQMIRAVATLDEQQTLAFLERLDAKGRATIDVPVSVAQHDTQVLAGTFTWFAGQ